jgi:hypothetical protein
MAEIPYGDKHRHPHRAAHRHSSQHRAEILQSDRCRCFYCLASYSPREIKDWVDEDPQEIGQTALCPKCGIDSVIGSASGVPLDDDFFGEMRKAFFS